MTAAAQLEVAGSGRSAPSSGHLNHHHNEEGKSAKPAAVLPPKVCNFRLSEVRNFRLTLTCVLEWRRWYTKCCLKLAYQHCQLALLGCPATHHRSEDRSKRVKLQGSKGKLILARRTSTRYILKSMRKRREDLDTIVEE